MKRPSETARLRVADLLRYGAERRLIDLLAEAWTLGMKDAKVAALAQAQDTVPEPLSAELEHERRRANANWNEADYLRGLLDEHGISYEHTFTYPASSVTAEGLAMQALQTIADWPKDINGSNSVDPRTHAATILRAINRVCGVVPPSISLNSRDAPLSRS